MKIYAFILLVGAACMVTCDDSNSDDIMQLCESGITLDCVRDYFSENGDCKVVDEGDDSPAYDEHLPIYLPSINLTVVTTDVQLSNMVGEFEAFYMDTKEGNLVLSVNFKALMADAPDTIFSIDRDGMEPKVFTDYVNATYPAIVTAVIPASNGITVDSMKMAMITTYFEDTNANLVLGPKFTQSEDPVVSSVLQALMADIPTALQEIFRTKGSYYFTAYLQNNICDFDLPVGQEYDISILETVNDIDSNDESEFMELCEQSDDMTECVRDYFEKHGSCSVVREADDEPISRDLFAAFMPGFNITAIKRNAKLSGLNGKIEKFYINEKTDNLIMTVDFEGIVMEAEALDVLISERGQQPKFISDHASVTYPVRLTAVIPAKDGLTEKALEMSYVSDYFTSSDVKFDLGSTFLMSEDPQVQMLLQKVLENKAMAGQEIFTTEGHDFFLAYLQKYICDYGISLSY